MLAVAKLSTTRHSDYPICQKTLINKCSVTTESLGSLRRTIAKIPENEGLVQKIETILIYVLRTACFYLGSGVLQRWSIK
jgi:hypothetical protein